jgi:hypothetical protein
MVLGPLPAQAERTLEYHVSAAAARSGRSAGASAAEAMSAISAKRFGRRDNRTGLARMTTKLVAEVRCDESGLQSVDLWMTSLGRTRFT